MMCLLQPSRQVEGPGVIDFEENICQEGRRVVSEEVDDVLQVTDATLGQVLASFLHNH